LASCADVSIPDISSWSAARVSQYLVQNGVKEKDAKVFFEQVCFIVWTTPDIFLYSMLA
jgi:hypothetical protein